MPVTRDTLRYVKNGSTSRINAKFVSDGRGFASIIKSSSEKAYARAEQSRTAVTPIISLFLSSSRLDVNGIFCSCCMVMLSLYPFWFALIGWARFFVLPYPPPPPLFKGGVRGDYFF